jgi:PAS domain S-box-containing protein
MSMDHSVEVLRLRATIRDLLALSAIPEVWVGRELPALATELADLLIESLRLDFAFVRLCDPEMRQTVEAIRGDAWNTFPEWLQERLAVSGQIPHKEIVNQIRGGDESCCGIVIPIGVDGERGLVAAACYRSDFPNQIDQQLLSVAANSAATAFRSAHLINELRNAQKVLHDREQELRTARDELEIRVAERTSELQRSAQELQRSEFHLAEGQRLGHTGSWALNPSGFFEHWSRELFQMYSLDPQKGAPTLEQYLATIHPQDRDFMAETVKRMCEQGSGCDAKKRIIRPDGAVRYIRCVGIPVLDNGVLKRFLGTAMDVTEQEQLTQELQTREAYLAEAQRLSQTGSWA